MARRRRIICCFFFCVSLFQFGCLDVSQSTDFRFKSSIGKVFVARYPSFVELESGDIVLLAPSVALANEDHPQPTKAAIFHDWELKGYSTLNVGVRILLRSVVFKALDSGDSLEARGTIIGGPLSGQSIVIVGIVKEPFLGNIKDSSIPDDRYYVLGNE